MGCRAFALVMVTGCAFQGGGQDPTGIVDAPQDGTPSSLADAGLDADDVRDAAPPDAPTPIEVTTNYPSTADVFLNSFQPSSSMSNLAYLIADAEAGTNIGVVLLRFDLSSLAPTATIIAAELHIWTAADPGEPCTLHQMLEPWSETSATWNSRSTGTAWSTSGARPPSRGIATVGTLSPSAESTEYTVPIETSLVGTWVATPVSNFGLALATVNSDGPRFVSREGFLSQRPYLRITHLP